jgi:hypothetical protein
MPLQNRVNPKGELIATPERGTMMGNRGGKFHRDDKTLGKRRWTTTHWICCELHWKGAHHEPMGQGYTSLFFLDEVTALAAGHRPCFFCRRQDAKKFLSGRKVNDFDQQLHAERLKNLIPLRDSGEGGSPQARRVGSLPQATMLEIDGHAYAIKNQNLLRWSFSGYTAAIPLNSLTRVKVLTPPSIIAILQNGYEPRWHESALQWG